MQDPRIGGSTTTLNGLLVGVALALAASQDGSKPSQSFSPFAFYPGAMMSKWQPKTRGGWPVEVTRCIAEGLYVIEGRVTCGDGGAMIVTWTKDGQHVLGRESQYDLIPLETPVEAPAEPDARKALAEAAKAYKQACDAEETAHAAERRALGELNVLLQDFGGTALVNIDGEVYRFELDDDEHEVAIEKIEVL